MTDFTDDKGIPGGWGEYFAAVNGLSLMMQSGKYRNFDEILTLYQELDTSTNAKYTALAALINAHINNQNNGDHKLTSADIGKGLVDNFATATAEQINSNTLFTTPANAATYIATKSSLTTGDANIHRQNINPISTYGDKTWLPVNLTKDYDGATAITAHSPEINMVEDNSTYIGLHAGTNGTTRGLYYHYLVDAVRRRGDAAVMNMHHKYTPKGLTTGNAISVISTDGTCIVGRIAGAGPITGFVSITKGDMNPANHKTAFLSLPWTEAYDTFSTACTAGDYIYLFRGPLSTSGNTNPALSTAYEFLVYRIQISTLVDGGTAAINQMNSWTCTGLHGTFTGTTIRLADCMTSDTTANRPLMLHNGSSWLYQLDPLNCNLRVRAEVNPDNANQIRLGIHHTAKATTVVGEEAYGFMAYSVLISIGTTSTAVVEDDGTYLTVGSGSAATISLTSGNMLNPGNIIGGNEFIGWANTCITRSGYLLSRFNGLIKNTKCIYTKSKIVGFVNKFTTLRYKSLNLNTVVSQPITLDTETDFTTNIVNPRSLPGNYVMMNGLGRSYPNQGAYSRGKRVQVAGTPTTVYQTVNNGNLVGYTNTSGVSDYSTNRTFNQCIFISRTTAANTAVSCDASVMYRGGAGAGTTIDQNGSISGVFTYTLSEAENVVYNALTTITGRSDIFQYDWVIYVPQDTTLPIVAVAGYTAPNGIGYVGGHVMFELNYTGPRNGAVTGYTYRKLCSHVVYNNTGKDVWLDTETMGGCHHYLTADSDQLSSIGCPVVIRGLNNDVTILGQRRDMGIIFFAAVKATTTTYETTTIKTFVHDNYPGGVTPGGVANSTIGLGVANDSVNNNNYNTMMVVSSMALTYAQFVSWTILNNYVMAAQKKTTSNTFRFYCDEPVFMSGHEYTIARKTVSLTSVTPAPNGRTFYVGALLSGGVVDYDISLTAKDSSLYYMPLGTISVSSAGVSTVDIRKPIRVDVYEMQTYRHGTGIPHTVDSPIGSGHFYWLSEAFNGVSFTYYDTRGVAHNSYDTSYDISYVLMNYNLNNALSNVTVTIVEDDGVDEGYFKFKLPGDSWADKTATGVTPTVPVGGSLRIDVDVTDDHTVAKRIDTKLKLIISFDGVRYITHTDRLGYQLRTVNTPDLVYKYIDNSGVEHTANDFNIFAVDLVLTPGVTMPNTVFTVTDSDAADRFLYSITPNGTYTPSITFTRTMSDGPTQRIYVQVPDDHTSAARLSTQMTVVTKYTNGLTRTTTSGPYGYQLVGINNPDVTFNYWDVAGNLQGPTNNYNIGYVDVVFNPGPTMAGTRYTVTDTNPNGLTKYSLSPNGPFTSSVAFTANAVNNGYQRIYVQATDNHTASYRYTTQMVVNSVYTNGVTRQAVSGVYGWTMVALNQNDISFIQYDTNGNARNQNNDFNIGSIDIVYNPGFTMPGTVVNISDTANSSIMKYSTSPSGPFTNSLQYTVSASNGGSTRIYVQVTDPGDWDGRINSQMIVNTSYINGLTRTTNSTVYGHQLVLVLPDFHDMLIYSFGMIIDNTGYFDIDFKTGMVTIAINDDTRGYTENVVSYYPTTETWTPGIQGTGFEDYDHYVTASKYYPAMALRNVDKIPNLSIRVGETVGRGEVYVSQQPNASNNYVGRVWVSDPQRSSSGYWSNVYLTASR